jgi:hypothetical protein
VRIEIRNNTDDKLIASGGCILHLGWLEFFGAA